MSAGTIKVAEQDNVYVIKMEGDVRLTLCLSFDQFIESILRKQGLKSVVFDLTAAQAIDSTTLGLMAKISIQVRERNLPDPIVISDNPSMTRLLISMGFEDIFQLVDQAQDLSVDSEDELVEATGDEKDVRDRVIEAHKVLMNLNENNKNSFRELVETLEGQS